MALRRPCAPQRATKPALVGLLNNAMSVSHILGVMSCKWPNFTAATAFEIQPRAIFFARSAEVGRWVPGFGFPAELKWVGGLRVSGFMNPQLGGSGEKTQSSKGKHALAGLLAFLQMLLPPALLLLPPLLQAEQWITRNSTLFVPAAKSSTQRSNVLVSD